MHKKNPAEQLKERLFKLEISNSISIKRVGSIEVLKEKARKARKILEKNAALQLSNS